MKRLIFALVLLVSIDLYAKVPVPCKTEEKMLIEKGIELDTKSIKGWVRILNNRSKQGEFGVQLTKAETLALIKCLTIELNNRKLQGKMS